MFSFFRYIKNKTPKLKLFWLFFGSIYRLFITILNINFPVNQYISIYGPFKIHCFFAFSNFKIWGSEDGSVFPLMMKKCINKKCIIDIGAHIGLTTLPISSQIKKNSNIFSFEPSNINRKYLNFHLFINNIKNVTVIDTLVGKRNSKNINFYESKKPTGMNSIINIKENHSLIKKNQISSDNFVNEKKIKPDLIKIDAEGSELYILEGAINILKKFKPDIFLSVHKNHLKKLNVSESQIINLIKKYGYKIKDSEEKVTDNLSKNEYYLSC